MDIIDIEINGAIAPYTGNFNCYNCCEREETERERVFEQEREEVGFLEKGVTTPTPDIIDIIKTQERKNKFRIWCNSTSRNKKNWICIYNDISCSGHAIY